MQGLIQNSFQSFDALARYVCAVVCLLLSSSLWAVTEIHVETAGTLQTELQNDQVNAIKLTISGRINGRDIKYMRQLINENNLQSINLSDTRVISGGGAYYSSYSTAANDMGNYCFQGFRKLADMSLPLTITKIGSNAFSKTGLSMIEIPDKVTTKLKTNIHYGQEKLHETL